MPIRMTSPIFRDGSCSDCHSDPLGPSSSGHIYLAPAGANVNLPPSGCP